MTTSLTFCAKAAVSRIEPIGDPQASVQWPLGSDTGSRYWRNRVKTLEFNPLTDVKTSEDLLDDPVHEPTVTNACSGHQPIYLLAQEIPHDGCLAHFPRAQQRLYPRLSDRAPIPRYL